MKENTHNGWSNYETWIVALQINNERGSYEYWRTRARELRSLAHVPEGDRYEAQAIECLANLLRIECSDAAPSDLATPYAELLRVSISEVDFIEIAESLFYEVAGAESNAIFEGRKIEHV